MNTSNEAAGVYRRIKMVLFTSLLCLFAVAKGCLTNYVAIVRMILTYYDSPACNLYGIIINNPTAMTI